MQSTRYLPLLFGLWACGSAPDGAVAVSDEELADLTDRGSLFPYEPWDPADARAASLARLEANRQVIEAFVADRPELEERLLVQLTGPRTPDGNREAILGNGQTVVVQGEGERLATIAGAIERFGSKTNQLRLFTAMGPVLPDHCRSGWPGEAEANGLEADALLVLTTEGTACWNAWRDAVGAPPPDPVDPPQTDAELGGGEDVDGECDLPGSYVYSWSSHRWALSPVKQQGRRGSCVAFGTVAAMEYAIARRYDRIVNLSEQALYAYGKFDLRDRQHYGDGLDVGELIDFLDETDYRLPFEGTWGYNQSDARMDDGERYTNSCVGYDNEFCSDTTHQLGLLTNGGDTWWWRPEALDDTGYDLVESIELSDFSDDDLDRAILLHEAGWGLVLSMDVTDQFIAGEYSNQGGEVTGGHALLVANILKDPLANGGARVLVKNSWGCGWGDAGYATLHARYANEYLRSLIAVRPKKRGGNQPPTPEINAPADGAAYEFGGILNEITFRGEATDLEDVDCCQLEWSSDLDGFMGRGEEVGWIFQTLGTHRVTVTARDRDGAIGQRAITVHVRNSSPNVTIVAPGKDKREPSIGQDVSFVGSSYDISDPLGVPCDNYVWTSSDPNDAFPKFGCVVAAGWDSLGARTVTLSVTDTAGATGTATVDIDVVPATGPTITIVTPGANQALVHDQSNTLIATTTASGFFAVTWTLDYDGVTYDVGTTSIDSFQPNTVLPGDCGFQDATLNARVSTGSEQGTDSIPVQIGWGPC